MSRRQFLYSLLVALVAWLLPMPQRRPNTVLLEWKTRQGAERHRFLSS